MSALLPYNNKLKVKQEARAAFDSRGRAGELAQDGMAPMPITPAAFDAQIRREIDHRLSVIPAAIAGVSLCAL
jgi:hypothetical protein